jgi:hypothetical protein
MDMCSCSLLIRLWLLFAGVPQEHLLFQELKARRHLGDSQILVLLFLNPGECVKCVDGFDQTFECLKQRTNSQKRLQVLALLRVDREAELREFVSDYQWDLPIESDYGQDRPRLGLSSDTRLAVFDGSGNLLGTVGNADFLKNDCERLTKIVGKHFRHRSQ